MRPRHGARGQSFASGPEDAVLDRVLCQRGRANPQGMFQIRNPFGRCESVRNWPLIRHLDWNRFRMERRKLRVLNAKEFPLLAGVADCLTSGIAVTA